MDVANLPDYFEVKNSDINLVDYKTHKNLSKQKVNLQHHTFSFLISGQKEVFTHTKSVSIKKTSFLLMKAGNCLMTEKISQKNTQYRSVLLFFSDNEILNFVNKHNLELGTNLNNNSAFSFNYDSYTNNFLKSLTAVLALPNKLQQQLLTLKLEELLIYLIAKNGTDFINHILDKNTSHFNKTIEANKLNKLTLKELSFLCHMSVATFKREFEKQYKTSPSKWFKEQRLENSKLLLKTKRPSEIYEEVGYESLSNFTQAFKLKYGLTPKQYQNQ